MRRWVLVTLLLSGLTTAAAAQSRTRLVFGGSRSNFGAIELQGGFEPDPQAIELTSGGNLDVRSMGLAPACRGFVTARPDYIVRYTEPSDLLRFHVHANGGDTTLVVHAPDDRWLCDDDSGGHHDPSLVLEDPPAGQYDVWVGSYRVEQNLRATLFLSEERPSR